MLATLILLAAIASPAPPPPDYQPCVTAFDAKDWVGALRSCKASASASIHKLDDDTAIDAPRPVIGEDMFYGIQAQWRYGAAAITVAAATGDADLMTDGKQSVALAFKAANYLAVVYDDPAKNQGTVTKDQADGYALASIRISVFVKSWQAANPGQS